MSMFFFLCSLWQCYSSFLKLSGPWISKFFSVSDHSLQIVQRVPPLELLWNTGIPWTMSLTDSPNFFPRLHASAECWMLSSLPMTPRSSFLAPAGVWTYTLLHLTVPIPHSQCLQLILFFSRASSLFCPLFLINTSNSKTRNLCIIFHLDNELISLTMSVLVLNYVLSAIFFFFFFLNLYSYQVWIINESGLTES